MRKIFYLLLIFLAGSVIGLFNQFLFDFWFVLDWWRPVADWLVHLGYERLAGYWGIIWVYLPIWFSGFISGIILGLIIARLNWLRKAAVFAIGFVFTPSLISYVLIPYELWIVRGLWASTWIVALDIFGDLIAISLLIFGVWMGMWFKRGKTFFIAPKQKQ
ncbi:MAG: hypothetical protein ACYS9Y_03645 [Planctomycetota bacterium]